MVDLWRLSVREVLLYQCISIVIESWWKWEILPILQLAKPHRLHSGLLRQSFYHLGSLMSSPYPCAPAYAVLCLICQCRELHQNYTSPSRIPPLRTHSYKLTGVTCWGEETDPYPLFLSTWKSTGRSGQIGRAQASRAIDQEFNCWSSHPNDLQNVCLSLPSDLAKTR